MNIVSKIISGKYSKIMTLLWSISFGIFLVFIQLIVIGAIEELSNKMPILSHLTATYGVVLLALLPMIQGGLFGYQTVSLPERNRYDILTGIQILLFDFVLMMLLLGTGAIFVFMVLGLFYILSIPLGISIGRKLGKRHALTHCD